jgi:hypothetical protein
MTDREKVTAWLKHIGAQKTEAEEVFAMCASCKRARAYFVAFYDAVVVRGQVTFRDGELDAINQVNCGCC